MVCSDMTAIEQKTEFLNWKMAPARLSALQAAWFLGFEPHEIPILVAAALLKPLGRPPRNGTKFFATEALEQLRRDEKWLARASDAICEYWRKRNARKGPYGHVTTRNARVNRPSARVIPASGLPSQAGAIE